MSEHRVEQSSRRLSEIIDLANDAEVRACAARLCVTSDELREMAFDVSLLWPPRQPVVLT